MITAYKGETKLDFTFRHGTDKLIMTQYHFHDTFEIYFSCCEGAQFFINDKIYPIAKNALFIFNEKDIHRVVTNNIQVYERYVVEFYPNLIHPFNTHETNLLKCFYRKSRTQSPNAILTEEQGNKLRGLFDALEEKYRSQQYGDDVLCHVLLCQILILINPVFENKSVTIKDDKEFQRINEIVQFIDANITNDLSLQKIAAHFYLSKYHLGCIFKSATGFTINNYIIHRRLMLAKEFIEQGISVTDTCFMSGFSNYTHFIRTFTAKVGISPKKYYRRNM